MKVKERRTKKFSSLDLDPSACWSRRVIWPRKQKLSGKWVSAQEIDPGMMVSLQFWGKAKHQGGGLKDQDWLGRAGLCGEGREGAKYYAKPVDCGQGEKAELVQKKTQKVRPAAEGFPRRCKSEK